MTVVKTKWLGVLSSDPDTAGLEEGSWWYNSSENRWKFYDGNEVRVLPVPIKKATSADVTIPIGGGSATVNVTASDLGLTKIEYVVNLSVKRKAPVVNDVYAPSYGINATNDAIGITLAAGTGTTLAVEVTVLGY